MNRVANVIFVLWVVFWIYWFSSAFGSKRNAPGSLLKRPLGIRLITLAVLILLILLHVPLASRHNLDTTNAVSETVGFVVYLLGLALAIWARLNLGRNWGMPMTLKDDPELVTSGPYKYIRHPIYSGILLAILGTAVAVNLFWLYVFIGISVYFIYSATVEEKIMEKQFPAKYLAYKKKSKMLVPFIF